MSRQVNIVSASLLTLGLGLFAWKFQVHQLPLMPSNPEGVWRVELEVTANGTARAKIESPLPSSDQHQVVFDETTTSDRLSFSIKSSSKHRTGVWSGRLQGVHKLSYAFRVQLLEQSETLPHAPFTLVVPKSATQYLEAERDIPAADPRIEGALLAIGLPPADDPSGILRMLFAFTRHKITTSQNGASDALLTLASREGSAVGISRLLVTMLRTAKIPARVVQGLELREDHPPAPAHWVEVWVGGSWFPCSPSRGWSGERPSDLLVLGYGGRQLLESQGLDSIDVRYTALRERLHPKELAAMMVPDSPVLAALSLYRLPVPTQQALRILLLLPIGALLISLFRNVIGLPTFGTFMPVLISVALKKTGLVTGLIMLGLILLLGVAGRVLLDRLRLLVVPRLSLLLCFVVLIIAGVALVGESYGWRDTFAGILFPIVILAMLIERFSIKMAEEGLRKTLTRSGWTTLAALGMYPAFTSGTLEHVMFGFPELVIALMGALVFIGGYTGYRLTDLMKFRVFSNVDETVAAGSVDANDGDAPDTDGDAPDTVADAADTVADASDTDSSDTEVDVSDADASDKDAEPR